MCAKDAVKTHRDAWRHTPSRCRCRAARSPSCCAPSSACPRARPHSTCIDCGVGSFLECFCAAGGSNFCAANGVCGHLTSVSGEKQGRRRAEGSKYGICLTVAAGSMEDGGTINPSASPHPRTRRVCDSDLGPKIGQSSFLSIVFGMWSMTRVSLRAFDCAVGTTKRLTTAAGTTVSETPA